MIEFFYETDFQLNKKTSYSDWVSRVIDSEGKTMGCINFIFCDDGHLLNLNKTHLNHDTYTDIITFDYCEANLLSGDIFISVPRIKDNAKVFQVAFHDELLRVMSHGILHLLGYNDKTKDERVQMRFKEEEKMKLFHVEQK